MQKTNKHIIWQTSHHAQNKTKTNKQSGLRLPFGETSRSLYDLPAPWPFAWHRCCLLWSVIFSASAQHHSAQPSIYDSALPVSSLCPRSLYRPSLSLSGQRYTCPPRIALNASAARRWHFHSVSVASCSSVCSWACFESRPWSPWNAAIQSSRGTSERPPRSAAAANTRALTQSEQGQSRRVGGEVRARRGRGTVCSGAH